MILCLDKDINVFFDKDENMNDKLWSWLSYVTSHRSYLNFYNPKFHQVYKMKIPSSL